jgi:E3 ubiquitin-protein ligase CHFR
MSDIGDLIQSTEVYECFDSNTIEVEYLLDYLTAQRLTPKHIYQEIVNYLQTQPTGFKPLMELELFTDVHGVAAGVDSNPEAPRNRICRLRAAEVLLWGLRDWWIRERQKGFLDEAVSKRQDCPEGSGCGKQRDLAHAREFNHVIGPPQAEPGFQKQTVTSETDALPEETVPQDAAMLQDLVPSLARTDSAPSSSQDFRDVADALM